MQRRSRLGQVTAVVGLAVLLVGRGPGSAQGEYDPYLVSSYSEALQEILPEHNWDREQDQLRHNNIQEDVAA